MKQGRLLLALVIGLVLVSAGYFAWLKFADPHPVVTTPSQVRITDIESTLPVPENWTGDLDGMLERRLVRILVPYSKTLYFLDGGRERGFVHDAGMELQKWLTRKYGTRTFPVRVIFIPTSRAHLLADLADGLGDIAAGNLTITDERRKVVDFTSASAREVDEIIVTGPDSPPLESLHDLAGTDIHVRQSSSYHEHLEKLNKEQKLGLSIVPADEALEDADLLEMVNAGLLPLAVVDNFKARFWAQVYEDITLREDLIVNKGGRTAWAIRKNSPELLAELNGFGKEEGRKKGLANMLLKRYLVSTRFVEKATDRAEIAKFDKLESLFARYSELYELDKLLLIAQGYQESRLDQSVRSRAGAVGIMQVLPSTAAKKYISIDGIEQDVEQNVHAGAKYMRHLLDTYLAEPELDSRNRLLLALAAYNAGPGNLIRFRDKAVEMGLDRNVWFGNVEQAAAKVIGRETVHYVSNIYKYYLAYRLVEERRAARR